MLYYFELYMYHNYCYRRKRHSYAACYIAFGAIIIMLAYSHLWSNRKQGLVTKLLEFYIPDCAPCFVFIKFLLEIYSHTFCNYHFFFFTTYSKQNSDLMDKLVERIRQLNCPNFCIPTINLFEDLREMAGSG